MGPSSVSYSPTICRNERASTIYTTELITKVIIEEGAPVFDARSASLGHTLQGGIPSPMDRTRAVRLSLKCMAFIEQHAWKIKAQPEKTRKADPTSACVITIQGSAIHLTPVTETVARTDFKSRRGVNNWWAGYKDLAETMGSKNYFRINNI